MSLRDLAHEVITTSPSDDLDVMVDDLLGRIGDDELRDALRQTLRAFLRQMLQHERAANTPYAPGRKPNGSWWVERMRKLHETRLRNRYHVGNGEWKQLAHLTYDDLLFAAEERRQIAKRNLLQADALDGWAALVARHGAATFGDLPADVLTDALGANDDAA